MDTLDKLQFLIGNWSSPLSGQPGQGVAGWSTFSYDLDKRLSFAIAGRNSRQVQVRPKGWSMMICW